MCCPGAGVQTPFCFVVGFISTSLYGVSKTWDGADAAQSIAEGLRLAWYGNDYAADFFAVALGTSIAGIASWIAIRVCLHRCFGVLAPKALTVGAARMEEECPEKEGHVRGEQSASSEIVLAMQHSAVVELPSDRGESKHSGISQYASV